MYSDDEELSYDPGQSEDPHFDQALASALRRVQPPTGFAVSVMARITHASPASREVPRPAAVNPSQRAEQSFAFHRTIAAVAAALLLVLFAGGEGYLRRQEQSQGRAAAMQFALAMRLTRSALLEAGDHVVAHGSAGKPPQTN